MKVIENGLVPIYQDEQRRVVNARELHGFLGVGKDFSTWIKGRLDKYGFAEGEDYSAQEVLSSPDLGNAKARPQIRVDYLLTIDTAKEIAMAENSEKGRQVRKYFIACEQKLHDLYAQYGSFADRIPRNFSQALRALADAEDKVEALEAKIEEDAPKVDFYDAVTSSSTSIPVGALAKMLCQNGISIGRNRLFGWLRDEGLLMSDRTCSKNLPTQRAMQAGLFEVVERVIQLPQTQEPRLVCTTFVTGKGQQYIMSRFLKPSGILLA